MIIKERGITEEVFTLYSGLLVEDVVNRIVNTKCNAVVNWIDSLDIKVKRTAIVGTYLTGMKLAETFSKFSNVTVIDINPHLKSLVNDEVNFSDDLSKIQGSDLVVDTTGLGGISSESVRDFVDSEIFIVEDPTSDGSDKTIKNKNNISKRLSAARSSYNGVLKTAGLNSKTSGTMTLTIEVLRRSLEDILKTNGVLYGVAGMNFYEGVLFKEKDCDKFSRLLKRPAMVTSSLHPLSPDAFIDRYMYKIKSSVENVSI